MENAITLQLFVDVDGILQFNKEYIGNENWGTYFNPFDAIQFVTICLDGSGEPPSGRLIPAIHKNEQVTFNVIGNYDPKKYDPEYQFDIIHFSLNLVNNLKFDEATPRMAWSKVLNLTGTEGAIGYDGYFYLGPKENDQTFSFTTCEDVDEFSSNIGYSLRFAIKEFRGMNGIIHYCQVDPLLRTSGSRIP